MRAFLVALADTAAQFGHRMGRAVALGARGMNPQRIDQGLSRARAARDVAMVVCVQGAGLGGRSLVRDLPVARTWMSLCRIPIERQCGT
jgi:hypothetical protein